MNTDNLKLFVFEIIPGQIMINYEQKPEFIIAKDLSIASRKALDLNKDKTCRIKLVGTTDINELISLVAVPNKTIEVPQSTQYKMSKISFINSLKLTSDMYLKDKKDKIILQKILDKIAFKKKKRIKTKN